MNTRQTRYKANRVVGMSQYNAARAAGYSETYSKRACQIEKSVELSIQDALEQAGLTTQYQSRKLAKLTNAQKVISCNIFIDSEGNMKKADGKSLDFIEVDDPAIQLRALEHVANLKKQLSSKVEHSGRIDGGESRIYIINGTKEVNDRTLNNSKRIPEKISV